MKTAANLEALRVTKICNACRYCEGHCAVFPAISRQLTFDEGEMEQLAHLCHQCGACYQHCQYAPPHEFAVNFPRAMADVREASYPTVAGTRFTVISTIAGILLFASLVTLHAGPGALIGDTLDFYSLLPHYVMAATFGGAALLVLAAWWFILSAYWRRTGSYRRLTPGLLVRAVDDAVRLKNLGGGHGDGCYASGEQPSLARRRFHHLTVFGFLLCFLATGTGTFYHFALDFPAPYGLVSLPKLFGMTGGIALLAGTTGLLRVRTGLDPAIAADPAGATASLTWLLLLTALTGLILPFVTTGKGLLLAVHLGIVMALFINFALGRFLHGLFRLLALVTDRAGQEAVCR